jgi:hypothetical protein
MEKTMPTVKLDLTGAVFGRLTVLELDTVRTEKGKGTYWHTICQCGNRKTIFVGNLRSGHTTSCGCFSKEQLKKTRCNHFEYIRSRTYRIWSNMLTRCTNPNVKAYRDYGGRGITVDSRWYKFENFLIDMGESPPNMTIERIDNSNGYSKNNCRWATVTEQGRNKRNNVVIEYGGISKCLSAWCEDLDVNYGTMWARLFRYKMPIHVAFSQSMVDGVKLNSSITRGKSE